MIRASCTGDEFEDCRVDPHPRVHRRNGFALMATLWIVVAIAAVTLSMSQSAHMLMNGARNRTNIRIATWHAEGCLSRVRARLTEALGAANQPSNVWDSLDVYAPAREDGCLETAIPDGATLDIDDASARAIRTMLDAAGVDPVFADSIISFAVAGGHNPYGSREEMLVAGGSLLRRAGADTLLGVDTGRVNAARTPPAVRIGAVVDLFGDTVRVDKQQSPSAGRPPVALPSVNGGTAMVSPSPEAWWVRIEASRGSPAVTVRLEAHVVLLGRDIGVEDIRL